MNDKKVISLVGGGGALGLKVLQVLDVALIQHS